MGCGRLARHCKRGALASQGAVRPLCYNVAMPAGEAILLGFMVLCVLGAIAWRVVVWDTKRRQLQRRGVKNAADARTEAELVCTICHKKVEPNFDVFEDGWKHVKCFTDRISEKAPT